MKNMMAVKDKILIHFNTNEISVYGLKDNTLTTLGKEYITFKESSFTETTLEKINKFLDTLENYTVVVDNEHIRLYATGIFQEFTQSGKDRLINCIFVDYGLYFNIVQPDLERFYLEKSVSIYGSKNIMQGLLHQEFRNVVVCGSFQQFLKDIEDVITNLHKHNNKITVLSPWTTKIKPETIGTNFILFDYQDCIKNERDTWRHKYEHMDKFRQSDAIIVCDPNGIVGKGTIFEFGFMVASSKRIIFTEQPKDLSVLFPYEVGLNF
jgi:hypothetical protein